jgi:hypothetical protein
MYFQSEISSLKFKEGWSHTEQCLNLWREYAEIASRK